MGPPRMILDRVIAFALFYTTCLLDIGVLGLISLVVVAYDDDVYL